MAEKQPEILNLKDSYVTSTSGSKEDFNLAGSSSQQYENDGAYSARPNPQPTVAFSTISRLPIFRRLRYGQRYPGVIWERHERYNEFMPRQYVPDEFESDSSIVSREYQVMDYMAFGFESDEYYEADDEADNAWIPSRERRPIGRGQGRRYIAESGTRESIVHYLQESGLSFAFPPPINISPRPSLVHNYGYNNEKPPQQRDFAEKGMDPSYHSPRNFAPPPSMVQYYGENGLPHSAPILQKEQPRMLPLQDLAEAKGPFSFPIPHDIQLNPSNGRTYADSELTQSAPTLRQSIVRDFAFNRLVRSEPIPRNIGNYDVGSSMEAEYSE